MFNSFYEIINSVSCAAQGHVFFLHFRDHSGLSVINVYRVAVSYAPPLLVRIVCARQHGGFVAEL